MRRQFGIGNYIIDFYCTGLKLAIEIDGDIHHFSDKKKTDKAKEEYLNALENKVIRINNVDLDEDYESVLNHLENLFIERARELGIEIKH